MGKRIICSARRAAGLTPLFLFHRYFSYAYFLALQVPGTVPSPPYFISAAAAKFNQNHGNRAEYFQSLSQTCVRDEEGSKEEKGREG